MSITGWVGLGFIWLVLAAIIGAFITWTIVMRHEIHLGWARYDERGNRQWGAVAIFVFVWGGLFALGTGIVNAVKAIRYTADFFAWMDSWFL